MERGTDAFICGSDQIWNPSFQPNSLYYLSFSEGKPKYSYAASIAVDTISERAKSSIPQHFRPSQVFL
jgi:hypothetical protein